MKILLLSAYDAISHQYWRKGLVATFPEYEWTVLTLPARFFSWRIRGNSLSWAFQQQEILSQDYDLLIATSMVDLTSLRGFIPSLAQTPTLVYFHENQFAYPPSGKEYTSVEPRILNLYNALCGDRLLFNSRYNLKTLLAGSEALLKKLPDQVPAGLIQRIEERACIQPVPLPDQIFLPHQPTKGPLSIVWNHRWEFDKGPDRLLAAIKIVQDSGTDFRLHIVGQQFRQLPKVFSTLRTRLSDQQQLGMFGHIADVNEYRHLLQTSDIVLSTALHDFQGIAVLEGVACGCYPVVPDRLAYQELFPAECRYAETSEAASLANLLTRLSHAKSAGTLPSAPAVDHLSWSASRAAWQRMMLDTAGAPL